MTVSLIVVSVLLALAYAPYLARVYRRWKRNRPGDDEGGGDDGPKVDEPPPYVPLTDVRGDSAPVHVDNIKLTINK